MEIVYDKDLLSSSMHLVYLKLSQFLFFSIKPFLNTVGLLLKMVDRRL